MNQRQTQAPQKTLAPTHQTVIDQLKKLLQAEQSGEASGHDWFHTERVWNMARQIAMAETATSNLFVVEAGALLHDVADWKFHDGDLTAGPARAQEILAELHVEPELIDQIKTVISQVSFKGAKVKTKPTTFEAEIVQDADRLDALGAIGIARTFAFGGAAGRELYNPTQPPVLAKDFAQYQQSGVHTLNHFYEKLLLLKDLMNTMVGKKLATHRHQVIADFLAEFLAEWEGKV